MGVIDQKINKRVCLFRSLHQCRYICSDGVGELKNMARKQRLVSENHLRNIGMRHYTATIVGKQKAQPFLWCGTLRCDGHALIDTSNQVAQHLMAATDMMGNGHRRNTKPFGERSERKRLRAAPVQNFKRQSQDLFLRQNTVIF